LSFDVSVGITASNPKQTYLAAPAASGLPRQEIRPGEQGCSQYSQHCREDKKEVQPDEGIDHQFRVAGDPTQYCRKVPHQALCGVLYADQHIGQVFDKLADLNIFDDTALMISADHGETLGELNIYGDHQTADELTSHIPMILRWPGITEEPGGRVDRGFHYHFDVAASVLELLGAKVPSSWDGRSFATALREGRDDGRESLVLSQAAWSCQRSVRWDDWLCIRTYHDGYHDFPEVMLFDVGNDPHETADLAGRRPEVVEDGMARLDAWHAEMTATATRPDDPMQTVMKEGGPFHTRGQLGKYLERLRATDREQWARALEERHAAEIA
jgi:choline-sulfatase